MEKKIKTVKEVIDVLQNSKDLETDILDYFSFSCKGERTRYEDRSKIRIKQSKTETFELYDFLKDKEIESYMEIGLQNGGSFILTTAYLAMLSPEFRLATGLDLENQCDYLVQANPDLNFHFCNCLNYEPQHDYDFIFIDTNQRYESLKKTFEMYKEHCNKYIAFHDVDSVGIRWGAPRLFAELREQDDHKHFCNSAAGGGLIILGES
jgi:hypothetical protein